MKEKRCPFCLHENYCMVETSEMCWCHDVVVPDELIELLPQTKLSQSCICQKCIDLFHKDPSTFKAKYGHKSLKSG
ncbi:Cysteine-rich CWC [Desulfuromusa kysingii]|uniref:Cysteine-rich CWC n=1 Tax=Desulfuromusa kysingii TaxID=37625 RepID=A0A1H4BI64_9BACT|nr:Cysteine-rich CWC [Desulfuromusa kysingii]